MDAELREYLISSFCEAVVFINDLLHTIVLQRSIFKLLFSFVPEKRVQFKADGLLFCNCTHIVMLHCP